MRPLYISPRGRGGVDFGIQNILRSVRRFGAPQAELLQLPEVYNFAPALIPRGLPEGWWRNFDVIQGRSRVAFALRAPGRPLVTTVHHLTTDPALQPYSSPAQRLFYRTPDPAAVRRQSHAPQRLRAAAEDHGAAAG